ncbi:MAG: hypothetical protein NVSMB24_25590 [Mucilaginibacter sp.]
MPSMNFKVIVLILTGYSVLSFSNVKAQTDSSKISPSHLALANQLISTTGMTDVRFLMMRNNTIKSISASISENNRQSFTNALTAFMNKYLPQEAFKAQFVKMYAELFTESELNQLIAFYNSPLGKKITSKLPDLMQEAALLDQQILVKHSEELQTIINDAVKE